jgi:hypothetical protein
MAGFGKSYLTFREGAIASLEKTGVSALREDRKIVKNQGKS